LTLVSAIYDAGKTDFAKTSKKNKICDILTTETQKTRKEEKNEYTGV